MGAFIEMGQSPRNTPQLLTSARGPCKDDSADKIQAILICSRTRERECWLARVDEVVRQW